MTQKALKIYRFARTVRHFPVQRLFHRLRLRVKRSFYKPKAPPQGLFSQISEMSPVSLSLWGDGLPSFWLWQHDEDRSKLDEHIHRFISQNEAYLLNRWVVLPDDEKSFEEFILGKTPLFKENYGYLEFLRRLSVENVSTHEDKDIQKVESHLNLFWKQSFSTRTWSTYGVARRLLSMCHLFQLWPRFDDNTQLNFVQNFYEEACFLGSFLEKDIEGNHLVRDFHALAAVASFFQKCESTRKLSDAYWAILEKDLLKAYQKQLLDDGVHFERTPMYHVWVLLDLLETLAIIKNNKSSFDVSGLEDIAKTMLSSLDNLVHVNDALPMMGDSSRLQTPKIDKIRNYGRLILGEDYPQVSTEYFENAGFCRYQISNSDELNASLILDCGDYGPTELPAHSHCDLASFEVTVGSQPVIVDSGISEYESGLVRDYFRSTSAHNTLWVPGEEQAEFWGSFRVAEYPKEFSREYESDDTGTKVTVEYENHNQRYGHQRTVYQVENRFWTVQDWVTHLNPKNRECYSLLHIHPDCDINYLPDNPDILKIETPEDNYNLMVIPFGCNKVSWSHQSPWRQSLNLYSDGFDRARPGKLIAMTPKLFDCFGWVIIPSLKTQPLTCRRHGEFVEIAFNDGVKMLVGWDAEGLRLASHQPVS